MKYCPACHKTYSTDYYVCPADQTGLQSAHELQPGMIIRNKYEILGRIGIGGMGVVYRGRHLTFNEVCAIKIVNDAIAGDANFLQRFQTEAVVTRKLRHPNAVRVDDFDYTDDGRPFIVMELVEGKNISEILHEEGPLRAPRAVRIATQAARALGVAHKLGIVHRDIKPGNIILATDEQGQETAKVLDFGIAKLLESAGDAKPGMTMTGMMVGTPLYMSPEQFMGKKAGDDIDGRTDIYSLGVVLYQMVTARLPFEGDTIYSLMMQHMEGNPRPPHELVPELNIPESLSRVILKAIDKSRDQRFQTAEEFIAGLDQAENNQVTSSQAANAAVENDPRQNDPTQNDELLRKQITNLAAPAGASLTRASQSGVSQSRASQNQAAPTAPKSQPFRPANVPTPPSAAPPSDSPVVAQPSAGSIATTPTADSVLVKSAAQHVLLQPKKFRLGQLLTLVALILAAVLVAWVGYVKYQSLQRLRIESAVNEKLNTSQTLRQDALRVFVSDTREVFLDGNVSSTDDSTAAEALAASVPGVTGVTNRVQVVPAVVPAVVPTAGSAVAPAVVPPTVPAGSAESLIGQGTAFLDAGDYAAAIDCFQKASADPNNKEAKELLDRARRAQKTEEELLRNRR
jgi:serine/threonine protein kinase